MGSIHMGSLKECIVIILSFILIVRIVEIFTFIISQLCEKASILLNYVQI